MSFTHGMHEGVFVVLADSCERCRYMADNLALIDDTGLEKLTSIAAGIKVRELPHSEISESDYKASENLRLMGRLVFKAGMTEEVAR